MTVLERAQIAAVFLAKWVDAAEEPGPRITARIRKALAMADALLLESATPAGGPANPKPREAA